jgi:AraC family transcriptional regulator
MKPAATEHRVNVLRMKQAAPFRIVEKCYEGNLTLGRHRHPTAYVSFLLAGGYIEVSGYGEIACPAGTVIWHPSTEAHSDRFHPKGAHLIDLEVADSWLREAEQSLRMQERSRVFYGGLPYRVGLEVYRALSTENCRIEDVVTELLSFFFSGDTDRNPPTWFKRAVQLVGEHECEHWSLAAVARIVGVHPVHLSRSFRRFLRCTFGEHQAKLRVRQAFELLRKRDRSIADVAYSCGFADHAHLCRVFKDSTGLTPSTFRDLLPPDC